MSSRISRRQAAILAGIAAFGTVTASMAPRPAHASAVGISGRWLAEDIGGGGVIDRLQTVLEIRDDGAVSGSGGCNRFAGRAEIAGNTIRFGPIAGTRMMCPPASMDQETKFFAALPQAVAWSIDQGTRKLSLLDAVGRALVVLARMD